MTEAVGAGIGAVALVAVMIGLGYLLRRGLEKDQR